MKYVKLCFVLRLCSPSAVFKLYAVLRLHSYSKGKAVPQHTYGGAGGRVGIAPAHSQPWHKMGVSGQHHAPAMLYCRGKDPWYQLDRRLGGPQIQSGHRG
jgi:hypothetical protein